MRPTTTEKRRRRRGPLRRPRPPSAPSRISPASITLRSRARSKAHAAAAPARRPNEPLPPPTRSSPTSDGSQGRGPDAPKLTPEYLAKWNVLAASRISGSYEYDNIHNCLPPGMPAMMSAAYGMEIMQDEQKITFFSEHQDALRRVYLDGRKPTAEVLADPTYAGYSTGRWEGDTLVVDTVALTTKSYIDGSSPHSDKMTVQERMRFVEPGAASRIRSP